MKNQKKYGAMLGLGVAIGSAIGVATDNLALWLGVGIAIGAGLGSYSQKKAKSDKTEEDQ